MDLVKPMDIIVTSSADDRMASELIYTRAGVALPRQAQRRVRARASRENHTAPVRYTTQTFTARSVKAAVILEEAYRLRARVFMGELGWLAPSADGRERDRCDQVARHFAVFAHSPGGAPPNLVGYARALLPRDGFMLQREFIELLGGDTFTPDSRRAFEVSRFVIHPARRGHRCEEGRTITEYLARGIAHWALAAGRDEWYTVCETHYLRALRLRGLEFSTFGLPMEYQPGIEARAAVLRLSVAARGLRVRRPHDYAWYLRGAPSASRLLERAL